MGRRYRVAAHQSQPFLVSLDHVQSGRYGFGPANEDFDMSHYRLIGEELAECLDRTWAQIDGITDNRGRAARHGYRPYDEQDQRLRDLVDRLGFEEDELDVVRAGLFRFRIGDAGRLWGFVQDGVFYAMWWDPCHRLNDRNTSSRREQ